MSAARKTRGFTLAEVMVGVLVTAIVLAAVLGTFLAQQRVFQGGETSRRVSEGARDGVVELERTLRLAGFGLDPRWAFDFQWYRCPTPGTCRDKVNRPDELVFAYRNPNYRLVLPGQNVSTNPPSACALGTGCLDGNAWDVLSISTAGSVTVTLKARKGQTFPVGTELLFLCPGATRQTMGRIQSTAPVAYPTPLPDDTNVVVTLVPTPSAPTPPSPPDPYLANDFSAQCFLTPGVGAFLVERARYFVSQDAGGVPWLMLDTGRDVDGDRVTPDAATPDLDDLLPIAQGVEDLQVAYVMLNGVPYGQAAQDSDGDFQVGDVPGTQEEPNPRISEASTPKYADATSSANRFNLHPGNIRAVRTSLVVRSVRTDGSMPPVWAGTPPPSLENRNAGFPAPGRFLRTTVRSLVDVRNLDARSIAMF